MFIVVFFFFFFSSRRRHTRLQGDWSSDVCSSDLEPFRNSERSACRRSPSTSLCRHLSHIRMVPFAHDLFIGCPWIAGHPAQHIHHHGMQRAPATLRTQAGQILPVAFLLFELDRAPDLGCRPPHLAPPATNVRTSSGVATRSRSAARAFSYKSFASRASRTELGWWQSQAQSASIRIISKQLEHRSCFSSVHAQPHRHGFVSEHPQNRQVPLMRHLRHSCCPSVRNHFHYPA